MGLLDQFGWQGTENPLPDAPGAKPYHGKGGLFDDLTTGIKAYANTAAGVPLGLLHSLWSGATAPGDAYTRGMTPDEMQRRAWDTAGLTTFGAGIVPAEAMELRTGMKFPLYHGSPEEGLTELQPSTRGALGPGTYTSPNSNVAQRYGQNLYTLPEKERNIFNGLGSNYGDYDTYYDDWKADKAALIDAVEPHMRDVIVPRIEKSWLGDGYSLYRNIAVDYRSEAKATDLFRRAGFEGIGGHADGPEVVLFGKHSLGPVKGGLTGNMIDNTDWFNRGGT